MPDPDRFDTAKAIVDAGLVSAESLRPAEIGPVAGIIKTPGVDDILERVEQEEDYANARKEWHEGRELSPVEMAERQTLFMAVLREANRQLLGHGVVLLVCAPNPKGFGAVFLGTDREGREYDATMVLPPEKRYQLQALGEEQFVRELIGMVVGSVVEKRREYLRRGGLAS